MASQSSPPTQPLHIAFIGCGALGGVYAAHLARQGAHVCSLTRSDRHELTLNLNRRWPLPHKAFSTRVPLQRVLPQNLDLVVLAVRNEQLDEQLAPLLRTVNVPLVCLTPLYPRDQAWLRSVNGQEPICALPAVACYPVNGVLHYFLPPTPPTLIDASAEADPAVQGVVRALNQAGLKCRFCENTAQRNQATTTALFPVALALGIAGHLSTLLRDRSLLELTSRALDEAQALAAELGTVDPAADWLRALLSPRWAPWWSRVVPLKNPEIVQFIESHFARKLALQNLVLSQRIVELGQQHKIPLSAFQELLQRFSGAHSASAAADH